MLMTIQLTLGFLLTLPVPFSYAHEWYSNECCSDRDCHPVADGVVKELADGVHVQGWDVLKYTDSRLKWSQDAHNHICVNSTNTSLYCVYRIFKAY